MTWTPICLCIATLVSEIALNNLALLTRLLCAGLPRLQDVGFYERAFSRIGDEFDFDWEFSVLGDGQVELTRLG
jgi:hypothetical protein